MSDFNPMFYAVGFLLFVGLVVPWSLGFFVDNSSIEVSPLVSPLVNVINYDLEIDIWGLPALNFNPFAWFDDFMREPLVDSLTYLSLFPDWLILFIEVLFVLAVIYTIIKMAPTT